MTQAAASASSASARKTSFSGDRKTDQAEQANPPAFHTRPARKDLPPLPAGDTDVLNHLCAELQARSSANAEQGAPILHMLDALHRNRNVIERCLRSHWTAEPFQRFCTSLDQFVGSLVQAHQDGRLDLNTLANIETVCLGLTSCTFGRKAAFNAQSRTQLRLLSKTMQQTVQQEDEKQGLKSPGQRLNIQNWVHHGVGAGVIECDAEQRAAAGITFGVFLGWARNAQAVPMDGHNLGKCAIQVQSLCHPGRNLLDSRDPQVKQQLLELMQYFCSPQSSDLLFAAPFDPVPLANVCTCLRWMLTLDLASAAESSLMLDRLITPLSQLAATLMQREDSRAMTRVANLMRQLLNMKLDQHLPPEMALRWARAMGNLLESCQAASFKSLSANMADLANLLNLAQACRDWRARNAEQSGHLPAPAQIIAICQTILGRIQWPAANLDDTEVATSLMTFLCTARSEALLEAGDIDPHLQALLQAIAEQGQAWSARRKGQLLALIRSLSDSGFNHPSLQPALAALQSTSVDQPAAVEDAPELSTPGFRHAPAPRLVARDVDGFQLPSHTAKPIQADARALAIQAALDEDTDSSDYASEEELESGAAVSTTITGNTSTATTTLLTPSRKDTRPLEQQLAEVPKDYPLHVPDFVPDRKKELAAIKQDQGRLLASTLQVAQYETQLARERAVVASPPQSTDAIMSALFQRLYTRMLQYIVEDNADKLAELLAMPQGAAVLAHRDDQDRSVLQILIANRSEKIFAFLTGRPEFQQAVRLQALQRDARGNTPLIVAAWSNHLSALEFLLAMPEVKKKLFDQRRKMSAQEIAMSISAQMKAIVAHEGNQPVLEPDIFMNNSISSQDECDAFQIALKNASLDCLQRLLREPLIQEKLGTAHYARQVIANMMTKPSPAVLRTMLALEPVRKKVSEEGTPLLGSLIRKGDLESLNVLLQLTDARKLLDQRMQTPRGPISVFAFLDMAPAAVQPAMRKLLQNAWNARLEDSPKKQ